MLWSAACYQTVKTMEFQLYSASCLTFETSVGSKSLEGRVGNLNNNTPKASTPISENFLYIVCKVYGKSSSLRALLRSQYHIFLSKNQYIIFERLKGKRKRITYNSLSRNCCFKGLGECFYVCVCIFIYLYTPCGDILHLFFNQFLIFRLLYRVLLAHLSLLHANSTMSHQKFRAD